MVSKSQQEQYVSRVVAMLQNQRIAITDAERGQIEIADFGLGHFEQSGLGLLVYVNNQRYCAKEIVMLPGQTCPEHRHPPFDGSPGKTETFRCRSGIVYLYIPGPRHPAMQAKLPPGSEAYYSVFHEIQLTPGAQYTIEPNTLHWFQAGPQGAIVSEFSSPSHDELDVFTDPHIVRVA